MKALLRATSLGTCAPGNTARVYGSEESLLPQSLCIIFRRAKDFGGGVFALAATVMSDLIHKDPTSFPVLDAAGLPSAFLDAILDGVLCSAEAITCIPQCLDALCLNTSGLEAVKDRKALRCFVKIFTSRTYLRSLTGDTPVSLSSGLDELMRHASSLRALGVDMVIEILNVILRIGSGVDTSYLASESSAPVPMETDSEERNLIQRDDCESSRIESSEQIAELPSDTSLMNIELFLPDCISNVGRLLETILQNADNCPSVGQRISVAFKNFSLQHSASLARAVCSFLREHLKSTNELLASIGGAQIAAVEPGNRTKVLRSLSSLEGILSLSNFLLKGTTSVVSELSTADADILKDLGRTYREIIWQISLSNDSMADEKRNADQETESTDNAPSNAAAGRESDDDASIPAVRYMNPVFIRSGSQSLGSAEREYLSLLLSSEFLHRRSRHGLSRLRGGRNGRHLDAINIDSEVSHNLPETSHQDLKTKNLDLLVIEILNKLALTLRSFLTALVKGFTSPSRRRADAGSLSLASKTLGMALAKIFLEALGFSGYSSSSGTYMLSVKCRYLGKVVNDMGALTFDSRRRTCFTAMVNNFYVHGTFKELLTTFEATSQLLWPLPYSVSTAGIQHEKAGETNKFSHSTWLLDTLQCYCRVLEYFVNSTLLLFGNSVSQSQLLVQPVATGLSIGLFPVLGDPETHAEDPVQEDDELARALALSLGNSSETSKADNVDKPMDVMTEEGRPTEPPIDDILSASVKFQSSDNMTFH
ncbi:hypothetical protein DITRI_Ditri12bG0112000 [Diplodiscus trichospermus]